MKKFALIAALALSASGVASAAGVCALGVGSAATVTAGNFVTQAFTPKCSSNTYVDLVDDTQYAAAGAVSAKGNEAYAGHTNGGAVKKDATITCGTATACGATDAGTAATNGLTAAVGASS